MIRLNEGRYFGTRSHVVSLAGLRIIHTVYQPRAQLPRHWHSQAYVCLVAAGGFEERAQGRVAACAAGMAVWNPSGAEHEDRFGNTGARTWNLELTDAWQERTAEATCEWTALHSAHVTWLVTRIIRELTQPDSATALSVEGLLCALIGETSRHSPAIDLRRPVWVSRAQDRLRAEFREPPGVGELAQQAGVHRSHFARAFRRYSGCTVAEFVRRLRIEWAAEQMRLQNCTLSELSLRAGFGDQAHFTRTFKRITGITPGAYRVATR